MCHTGKEEGMQSKLGEKGKTTAPLMCCKWREVDPHKWQYRESVELSSNRTVIYEWTWTGCSTTEVMGIHFQPDDSREPSDCPKDELDGKTSIGASSHVFGITTTVLRPNSLERWKRTRKESLFPVGTLPCKWRACLEIIGNLKCQLSIVRTRTKIPSSWETIDTPLGTIRTTQSNILKWKVLGKQKRYFPGDRSNSQWVSMMRFVPSNLHTRKLQGQRKRECKPSACRKPGRQNTLSQTAVHLIDVIYMLSSSRIGTI